MKGGNVDKRKIVIYGKPIQQQRFRFKAVKSEKQLAKYRAGQTKGIMAKHGLIAMTYNPQSELVKHTQLKIKAQWHCGPLLGAIDLRIRFYMYIPKSTSKKDLTAMSVGGIQHTKKPDVSNLIKFYEDAMSGIVYVDDKQVVRVCAEKIYDNIPRVEIHIIELDGG